VIDRYHLVTRAERQRRTRITEHPRNDLPATATATATAGPEPLQQGDWRVWRARLSEQALQHDLNPTPTNASAEATFEGPELG
jgi:hypothetical protein